MKKKRLKRSRLRGRRTAGWGARQKRRGKGSRGGRGMAGTGKRAGQRKIWILKKKPGYFGKRGFVSRAAKLKVINIGQIEQQEEHFLKKGLVKKTAAGLQLDLSGYKVLGAGTLTKKLIIKASSFSAKAKTAIEKAGGQAQTPAQTPKHKKKKEEKVEEKKEKEKTKEKVEEKQK